MNCADLEILLCDYMDGTLPAPERAEVERHLAQCAACAEMAKDVQAAVGFMERAAEVEPPPELLTRILFELPPVHQARTRRPSGFRNLVRSWIQPILQPRFAMGFAMTILSFSLLARWAGLTVRQPTIDDFKPTRIWTKIEDQADRGWQRAKKYYESLRLVYEVQMQLRDWTQKEQERKGRTGGTTDEAQTSQPAGDPGQTPGSTDRKQPGTNSPDLRNAK